MGIEFVEVTGIATTSGSGRFFYQDSSRSLSANTMFHFTKTDGIACTPAICCASYSRVKKIYVGDGSSQASDQSVLDLYLADSNGAQYSSKLDLGYNYSGEYK